MQEIAQNIQLVVKNLFDQAVEVELTRTDEQFGDYATNIALHLSKKVGQSPREIAQKIIDQLHDDSIARAEVAGPGFINITLSETQLLKLVDATPPTPLKDKLILAEYSDPNPLKPLHAGHLYTTLIGDTIARLLEQAGAKVVRLNYGGDVGLHVAKSMWGIIQHLGGEHPDKLAQVAVAERPAWLGARYIEGNNAYQDNPAAKQATITYNQRIYQVHAKADHTSPFAQIYWQARQWSYDYFNTLYDQLAVKPFDRFIPESEVTPLGVSTVEEQLGRGVFKKSDGAVIFDGQPYGLHTRVFINSEGLPTYEAKDVGLSLTKWQDYQFDKSIIITANEQEQYMQVVIKAIEQFAPEPAERTRHLTHGMVKLAGGKKMSSRKGNVVTALEILAAASQAGETTGTNPDESTILAAVKYAFTKNRIGSDIVYEPTESIALEGNSGPYLQYAHARACSILRKSKATAGKLTDLDPAERSLLRKLSEYPEVVSRATTELMPHYICTYLYQLAQTFNRFYEHHQVIGDAREPLRLQLVSKYVVTLKNGLELLGISSPEKM